MRAILSDEAKASKNKTNVEGCRRLSSFVVLSESHVITPETSIRHRFHWYRIVNLSDDYAVFYKPRAVRQSLLLRLTTGTMNNATYAEILFFRQQHLTRKIGCFTKPSLSIMCARCTGAQE